MTTHNYETSLAPHYIAEQIFFYVLMKGGEGNPFRSINNKWFSDLAAVRIRELLTPVRGTSAPGPEERVYVQHGSQPQGKWISESANHPPAPWKEIGNLLDAWEQVNNDFKCQLQEDFPHLYRAIEQLLITVEHGDTVCMGCVSDGKEPHICPFEGDRSQGGSRDVE